MKTFDPDLSSVLQKKETSPTQPGKLVRRALPWLVLLGVLFLVYKTASFMRQPPVAEVALVKQETVVRTLAITGRIKARNLNRVQPVVAGRLVQLTRDEGDSVAAGEVLARIHDEAARAQAEQARAAAAAQSEFVTQARRTFERAQQLHASGLNSAEELENARLALESGEKTLRQFEKAIAEAEARLQDYVLKAPFAGFILKRPVDPGQTVGPETMIFEIAGNDAPEIEAEIDEQYLSELRMNMPARVAPLGNQSRVFNARICYIAKEVDVQTGAALVRFCFEEAPPALPLGLSLDVNLAIARHENALTVPRVAIAGFGAETHAFVVQEQRVVRRVVQVIDWQSERIVVLSGLAANEQVVLSPRQVKDGMEIRVRQSQAAL